MHQDKKGQTLLHKAVAAGRGGTVEKLLDAGVNTSLKDERGRTAASLAQERGDVSMYRLVTAERPANKNEGRSKGVTEVD